MLFPLEGNVTPRETELENQLIQANAILEAISRIVYSGEEPDDFMMSFALVREVWDLHWEATRDD